MRSKIVALFFISAIISISTLSGCLEIREAYIEDVYLKDWSSIAKNETSEFFGLGKWITREYAYKDNEFPAFLCITTVKTLLLMSEKDLEKMAFEDFLKDLGKQGVMVDKNSIEKGSRKMGLGHVTDYIICNGSVSKEFEKLNLLGTKVKVFFNLKDKPMEFKTNETVKILAEVWNCKESGVSVICLGVAQITNHGLIFVYKNTTAWREMVGDPYGTFRDPFSGEKIYSNSGLVYNVICHSK
ncbi:MAG: hypothetical protein FE038_01140 [Thermoplasmata archaeon]|nr:MAG: hypothetical protein FE038_01140 [Thermoplasmata archaeon]